MAEKFRSLIRVIVSNVNKHWLLNNATIKISNTTEKAQEKLSNMQNVVASKYYAVAKVLYCFIVFNVQICTYNI